MSTGRVLDVAEFEAALETTLTPRLARALAALGLRYEHLGQAERDAYVLSVIETLLDDTVPQAGEHRLADWERGWSENVEAYRSTGSLEGAVPRYLGKHELVRWRGEVVRPLVPGFEYATLTFLVDWVFETYLASAATVYEFGCGPGYHLLRLRTFNPGAKLVGLDWARASQSLLTQLAASGTQPNLEGRHFDFFAPDPTLAFGPNSAVYTVAALEQVGKRHGPFLQFLLERKPALCVHLEPIDELMNQLSLIDRLSVLYCRKRNYLSGFLTVLRALEAEGKVRILVARRTHIGSWFLEGHALVVWAPV